MPPIPFSNDMEKEFLTSLDIPIKILDTDDERVKKVKQAVIDMRAEVKQLMDNGQTFREIISEHQKLSRANAELRKNSLIELKRLIASGDIQGASEYKHRINTILEQMGIPRLSIPVTEADHAEIAHTKEQRRLERRLEQEQELK